jgi:hypothetical protein
MSSVTFDNVSGKHQKFYIVTTRRSERERTATRQSCFSIRSDVHSNGSTLTSPHELTRPHPSGHDSCWCRLMRNSAALNDNLSLSTPLGESGSWLIPQTFRATYISYSTGSLSSPSSAWRFRSLVPNVAIPYASALLGGLAGAVVFSCIAADSAAAFWVKLLSIVVREKSRCWATLMDTHWHKPSLILLSS